VRVRRSFGVFALRLSIRLVLGGGGGDTHTTTNSTLSFGHKKGVQVPRSSGAMLFASQVRMNKSEKADSPLDVFG
jgi:hypothetical protein